MREEERHPQPRKETIEKSVQEQGASQQEPRPEFPAQREPAGPILLTAENPAEKLREITSRLEKGIGDLFSSERYKEYLRVMSKFYDYSFNNTVLIAMQKPDASLIAGFHAWKNRFGRTVKKGEKGMRIIAPVPYKIQQAAEKKNPQTGKTVIGSNGKPVMETKEIKMVAYKVVSVFDVSQTEGKELPTIPAKELTGEVRQYKDFFAALENASPVPILFEEIGGNARGYYHLEKKLIVIDKGMSEIQTLKTAIHEIAHAKLHDIPTDAPVEKQLCIPNRRTREVQAESVAYTVCQHYGLDTSDYSFGYIAGWSSGQKMTELKSSLEVIRAASAEIITGMDGYFAELQGNRKRGKGTALDTAASSSAAKRSGEPALFNPAAGQKRKKGCSRSGYER